MPTPIVLALVFAAAAGAAAGAYSLLFVRGAGADRLRRLRGGVVVSEITSPALPRRSLKTLIADKLFVPVGKMLSSPRGHFRLRQQLQMAGYHGNRPVTMFLGAKIILAIGLPAAFWLYRSILDLPMQQSLLLAAILAIVGSRLPGVWLGRCIRKRQEKLRSDLPDCLDLLVVSVEAGMGLDSALLKISEKMGKRCMELASELQLVHLEMQAGKPRNDALRSLADRTGVKEIEALVAKLIQAEKFGTSIAKSLRVHSEVIRDKRRQRAEERAAKTVVKLLFPLVFFIFPALFVVILGPAAMQIMTAMKAGAFR